MRVSIEERTAELQEPIETIEAEIAAYQQQIDEAANNRWSDAQFNRLCFKADWAAERLRRAQQRTDVGRPAGCWCRGSGGAGKVNISGEDETHFVCGEYCQCEAGDVRRAADQVIRDAQRQRELAERLNVWLEGLPPSFRAFRSHEFATYPTDVEPQRQVVAQLKKWMAGSVPDSKPWLFLHGPVGVGKTGLAVVLGKELMRCGYGDAVLVDVAGLLSRIRRTYSKGADEVEGDVMAEMQDARVLILDDFGAERITDWVHEQLFSLINYRYGDVDPDDAEPNLTIITSNYDLSGLHEHIGGVAGERIAMRIGQRSLIVSLEDCENLRIPRGAREIDMEPPDLGALSNVRQLKKSASG